MTGVRIEHVITSGTFSLDGGTWNVDNNVWIVGDDHEAVVIDAAHDAEAIARAVGDRRLTAIVCTHAHNDHINAAPALAEVTGAPVLVHLDDRLLWKHTHPHPDHDPGGYLSDNQRIPVAGTELRVLHTPGHTPGAICLYLPSRNSVFTGDTLFAGGPGATGRSYSDFRPSSARSGTASLCCHRPRKRVPGTDRAPPSALKRPTSPTGSHEVTEGGARRGFISIGESAAVDEGAGQEVLALRS